MEKDKIYENYYSTHKKNNKDWNLKEEYNKAYKLYDKNIADVMKNKNSILDLGFGHGNFAYFSYKKGIKDYMGIDISEEQTNICRKKFPKYNFKNEDIFNFLNENKKKYDLIFMSHFFEHFTLEEGEKLLRLIKKNLNQNGVIINIMPNAGAYFGATRSRYIDITHERLYDSYSFSQILKNIGFSYIEHRNFYIGNNKFEHTIHKLALKIFEVFIGILGYSKSEYYTSGLLTIIKK